jgi:hypothetical protein
MYQEEAVDMRTELEQKKIRTDGWEKELNCLIKPAEGQIERRGSATQEQRYELESLLEERVRNKQSHATI